MKLLFYFRALRLRKFIPSYYWTRHSMFKFIDLLNSDTCNVCLLQKLGSFINYAFKIRSDTVHTLTSFVYLDFSFVSVIMYYNYVYFFLPSALCVCKYCNIAAQVYDLLVFIFNKQTRSLFDGIPA